MHYPLAGRLRDRVSIECNDEGVTFLVTHIKHKLSVILQNPKEELINPLFADQLQWKKMDAGASFLAIQMNSFACGGMAISVCMSHKVGDVFTLSNFVKDWASIAQKFHSGEDKEVIFPFLNGASVFPRGDLPIFPEVGSGQSNITTVCKRFVFEASKIKSLKAMVSQRVQNPTRVQVVGAFVYNCAVSALRSTLKCPKPNELSTCLNMTVNMRTRMNPPLPQKSVGNMAWGFNVLSKIEEELELHELVRKIQEGLCSFVTHVKHFGKKDMLFISECLKGVTSTASGTSHGDSLVFYALTSWCRFPTYEVDFGWGKPIWVTTSGCLMKNMIVLMDTKDEEGIEVLVNMEEQDLALFERNLWNSLDMFS